MIKIITFRRKITTFREDDSYFTLYNSDNVKCELVGKSRINGDDMVKITYNYNNIVRLLKIKKLYDLTDQESLINDINFIEKLTVLEREYIISVYTIEDINEFNYCISEDGKLIKIN